MADGTIQLRNVLETSERPNGIEFWLAQRNDYLKHGSTAKILEVNHGRPTASANPETHVHLHISAVDGASVQRMWDDHEHIIAKNIARAVRDSHSRSAVV